MAEGEKWHVHVEAVGASAFLEAGQQNLNQRMPVRPLIQKSMLTAACQSYSVGMEAGPESGFTEGEGCKMSKAEALRAVSTDTSDGLGQDGLRANVNDPRDS